MDFGENTFTLVCGLPGSGKTTLVRKVAAENPDLVVISSDDRIEERARAEGLSYQQAYVAHAKAVLAEIFEDAATALATGRPVLWDQTNLTEVARAERLALAPTGCVRQVVAFEVDEAELSRRLGARERATGKSIPDFVLQRQKADYVRPSVAEGFDRVWVCEGGVVRLEEEAIPAVAPRF